MPGWMLLSQDAGPGQDYFPFSLLADLRPGLKLLTLSVSPQIHSQNVGLDEELRERELGSKGRGYYLCNLIWQAPCHKESLF